MTISTVLPLWQEIRGRFYKTAQALPEAVLSLQSGPASIGSLLRHTAEVEYLFTDWFFGRSIPPEAQLVLSGTGQEQDKTNSCSNLKELLGFLDASNEHLSEAMQELSEEAWHQPIESPMGASTPLQALGRLMYHTGIHAGQISLIQKVNQTQIQNQAEAKSVY